MVVQKLYTSIQKFDLFFKMNIVKIEKWLFLEIKKFGEVHYREKEKKKDIEKKRIRREKLWT